MSHAGSYSLLSGLREKFWIPQFFSKVKKLLKGCVGCRRFNARTVKLNQNSYRDFRMNPPNWNPNINSPDTLYSGLAKLRKVRTKLIEDYNEEFTNNLISQAINDKNRYKPISHDTLDVGDVILLKETLLKPSVYPLAVVRKVVKNSLNEVTDVIAFKGKTQEIVKRHSSSIIPLYRPNINAKMDVPIDTQDAEKKVKRHTNRSAAHVSRAKTASMLG